jgi:hypothetical protein
VTGTTTPGSATVPNPATSSPAYTYPGVSSGASNTQ